MIKFAIYSFCLITLCMNSGSASGLSNNLIKEGSEIIIDKNLREVIKKYFTSEINSNWSETYKIRSSEFRKAINYKDYSREMSVGSEGWTLSNISIIELKKDKENYEILIKFDELITNDVKNRKLINAYIRDDEFLEEVEFNSETNIFSYTEKTLWRLEKNRWVAIEPGTRQHLYMNYKVVSEE